MFRFRGICISIWNIFLAYVYLLSISIEPTYATINGDPTGAAACLAYAATCNGGSPLFTVHGSISSPPVIGRVGNIIHISYGKGYVCGFIQEPEHIYIENAYTAGCEIRYAMDESDLPNQADQRSPRPINQCGSIIDVDNLALGESIKLIGTDQNLVYFTNRVQGRSIDYTLRIPIRIYPGQISPDANIKIEIAGRTFTQTFLANTITPTSEWQFVWDGNDSFGQPVLGSAQAKITYTDSQAIPDGFGVNANIISYSYPIGGWKSHQYGLGGWMITNHHYFDPLKQWIYMGDGSIRKVQGNVKEIDPNDKIIAPVQGSTNPKVYLVASESKDEAYLFDFQTGRHLYTKSTLSGKTLFSFNYDSQGRLSSVLDAFGKAIVISRPNNSQVVIQAPFGQQTSMTLDANGWATSITQPGNRVYLMNVKDSFGLLDTFTKPTSEVVTFSYDSKGYLIKDQSTSGGLWDLFYQLDPASLSKSIQMTSGEGRQYSYLVQNPIGTNQSVRTEISPGGATRIVDYTPGGRTTTTEADGSYVIAQGAFDPRFGEDLTFIDYIYEIAGTADNEVITSRSQVQNFAPDDELKLVDRNISETITLSAFNISHTSTEAYTDLNKTFTTTSNAGRISTYQVDDFNRPVQYQVANDLPIQWTYDNLGRLSQVSQGLRTQSLTYDQLGNLKEIKNSLNQSTLFSYNASQELTQQTLPDGRLIQMNYDQMGNMTSITTPKNAVHNFLFNLFDLIASYIAPQVGSLQTVTTYDYNRDKQITRINRPDGTSIDFGYAQISGLLDSITTPEGSYSRSYNSANQLIQISAPQNINLSYGYNTSLLTSLNLQTPSFSSQVTYTHKRFLPDTIKVQAGTTSSTISMSYDPDELLISAGQLNIQRDPQSGRVIKTTIGNIEEQYAYDPQYGEISSYRVFASGNEIFNEIYTRDLLGRIIAKSVLDNGVTKTLGYVYDSSGRLTQSLINGVISKTYTYDSNSNRTKVQVGSAKTNATYDAQDRLLTYGARKYTYTNLGDRLMWFTDTNIPKTEYRYDSLGALSKVIRTTKNATTGLPVIDTFDYLNDGLGRRIEVKKNGVVVERYMYDGQGRLIAEINSNGKIKMRFVYATKFHVPDYVIQGANRYKIIHDQLGSVRLVVDVTTGAIKSRINYDEFGRILSGAVGTAFIPFNYAGGIRDSATGLVRFGARDYDPLVGRWTSKDPILFNGGDTNLYGYVLQDPVNLIDPNGKVGIGAAIGATIVAGGILYYTFQNEIKNIWYEFDQNRKRNDWERYKRDRNQCPSNPDPARPPREMDPYNPLPQIILPGQTPIKNPLVSG